MSNTNRGLWIGIIAIVVVAVLGWWWIAANESIGTSVDAGAIATSTSATNTSSTGGAGAPAVTKRGSDTVKSIIASLPSASEYESLFNSSGVASMVGSGGQFTVFVPTNTAFSNLPKGTITNMSETQLKRLIEYSIISGRAIQPRAEVSGAVQAFSGDPLNFSDLNNVPMVNSSIVTSEYEGSNGVVYLISAVLLPPHKSNF